MSTLPASRFTHLDGWAIGLSGLCVLHCLATAVAIGLLSSFAGMLEAPIIHEGGLALAILLGGLALGNGARKHGRLLPVAVGALGLGMMAGSLSLPHGTSGEIAYSVLGVLLLALGHELNRRAYS